MRVTHGTAASTPSRTVRLLRAALAGALIAGGVVTTAVLTGAGTGQALATPGTPGTPQEPTVIYVEDFENDMGNTLVLLPAYTGASGMTYTADIGWLSNCNGIILSANTPGPGNCATGVSYNQLRDLVRALGTLPGGPVNPSDNHAVAAYTEGNPGGGSVEFQTEAPIDLPSANGRFLTFSVDAAARNCYASGPQYQFALTTEAGSTPVGGVINPCVGAVADPLGTYTSNGSVLLSGSSFGITMTNANGGGVGNDAAFDNIRVLDATPQLDKSFAPASVLQGGISTLTLTITNTSELAKKDGWGFSDVLPAGLTVAGAAATTCGVGTVVTAASGSGTVTVASGVLGVGVASCTVTVPVTSPSAATYTNGPGNVTGTGLNPPANATVQFTPVVDLAATKTASPNPYVPGAALTYTMIVSNAGPSAAVGASVADPLPADLAGAGFTWTCTASAGSTCTASGSGDIADTVTVAADGTLTYTVTGTAPSNLTGALTNVVTVTPPAGTTDAGCDPSCGQTITTPPSLHTALTVNKSASPAPYVPGAALTYTVTVANGGPSDAVGVAVSDPLPAELAGAGFIWTCAPSAGSSCAASGAGDITDTVNIVANGTAVYTVTGTVPAGVQGTLANTATVTPPDGVVDAGCEPDCSSSIATPAEPHTALSITKTADPDKYLPGKTLTYTITVSNAGPSDAIGASVSDPLPDALAGAGFTWTCAADAGSSCAASGSADIADTVTVLVGASVAYTVTGVVPAATTGDVVNIATVTAPPGAVDANCPSGCSVSVTTSSGAVALAATGVPAAGLTGAGLLLLFGGLLLMLAGLRRRGH